MRILVIGGTGFIGPAVVRHLAGLGCDVTCFHRGHTHADLPEGVRHILGDRRQLAGFAGEFRRLAPDVVVDMFPFSKQDAQTVTTLFKGISPRIVALSSQDVYRAYGILQGIEPGPPEHTPLTEDAPLRQTLYPYRGKIPRLEDYDKIVVERLVMGEAEPSGTILRLPMVYGPRDSQHRLFSFLKRMDDQRPAILMDDSLARWRWSRGYVDNVAAAIALACTDERATGRVYNVAEAQALSMAEWVQEIGHAARWNGQVVVVPKDRLPAHLTTDLNTEQHIVADTTRIREELGYEEPVERDDALRQTIAWERAHPPDESFPELFDYEAEDAVLAALC